jgi:hypothetical protein
LGKRNAIFDHLGIEPILQIEDENGRKAPWLKATKLQLSDLGVWNGYIEESNKHLDQGAMELLSLRKELDQLQKENVYLKSEQSRLLKEKSELFHSLALRGNTALAALSQRRNNVSLSRCLI